MRKDPQGTRQKLLDAAFSEIWENCFQAASLDRILRSAGMTRGALYHHFRSKADLGYAVVEETLGGHIRLLAESWDESHDPLGVLLDWINSSPGPLRLGCPLNNLAQEMSPLDEGFRQRIEKVFQEWRSAIARTLQRAQQAGQIAPHVDSEQVAAFILAAFEGSVSLAKNSQSDDVFTANMHLLSSYLESLRASSNQSRSS